MALMTRSWGLDLEMALRSLVRRSLSSSASTGRAPVALWRGSPNVDASRCFDPLVAEQDLQVLTDVLTEGEELLLADECARLLKRRRYEENHWDNVIVKFKEMERSRWSAGGSLCVSWLNWHGSSFTACAS